MTEPQRDNDDEESDADRRRTNIILLVVAAILVGGGVWLVNALIDARRAEECLESGRRNCYQITVPTR